MADQTPANNDINSIRRTLSVEAPQQIAWRVFTEQIGTWWPLAVYKIGASTAVDAIIEPCIGGRWYERGEDGSSCDWGRVLVWDPLSRLAMTWDIDANFQYDPDLGTEIEVQFIAEGETRTRVEFENRRLDRYGDRRDEMRTIYDQTGDWGQLLAGFATTAAAQVRAEV